jgi:NADH:ubiquinone oxidoreductase subunit 4 (subunit M)
MIQRVFFGERNERWASLSDADNWWERASMAALVVTIIGVGIYPAIVVDFLDTGMVNIAEVVARAG